MIFLHFWTHSAVLHFYCAMLRTAWYCYGKVVCLSLRPSATFKYRDHIGWNYSKIISLVVKFGIFAHCTPQHHGFTAKGTNTLKF